MKIAFISANDQFLENSKKSLSPSDQGYFYKIELEQEYFKLDKEVDKIIIDHQTNKAILAQILTDNSLYSNTLTLQRGDETLYMVSENVFNSISQSSTTNAGHTETDFLRHSSLDVEKVARTAFELAEEKHLNIIELHYATRYSSSYLWTRIIEDIAPDYQYESMIHVSLPIFIVTHAAYTVHNNLILVDPYFKEIALVLALHDGYKIVSNISSGRSYLTLEVK